MFRLDLTVLALKRCWYVIALLLLLFVLDVPMVSADGETTIYTVEGCYNVKSYGVGLFGDGAGSVTVDVPGPVEAAFIQWVGVEDETPSGAGTSILTIGNGIVSQDVVGTLLPGEAGLATTPGWYAWYANIGPAGAGLITESGSTTLQIAGWDSASARTNGATVTVVYSTDACDTLQIVQIKAGVDWYYWPHSGEAFTQLLVYEFPASLQPQVAAVDFSHAGTDHTQTSCRGGAIWMAAGSGTPPDEDTVDLVATGNSGRGFGINGGVEIVNDPFTSPTLPCTPTLNPDPDEPYEDGHPYPGGAAEAPYRAVAISPAAGGDVGPEWGVVRVQVLIPAGARWVAFQLESEADQMGESGSWAGTGGFIVPAPQIAVEKGNDADGDGTFTDVEQAPSGEATVTFRMKVANTAAEPLIITQIVDDVHGSDNALTTGTSFTPSCANLLGTLLAPGESAVCYFDGTLALDDNARQTDTIIVTAVDDNGNVASASDTSTVTTPDILPTVAVEKTANPASIVEPGGDITFTIIVTNTSTDTITLTRLRDNIHGDLNGQGTCTVPQTMDAGGSYLCNFIAAVTGTGGDIETDTVTAMVEDDDGNTATGQDSATVTIMPRPIPAVQVEKTLLRSGPAQDGIVTVGQEVTFTIKVKNTGPTALIVVPHQDVFDPAYLTFRKSTPAPDDVSTAGMLSWNDLTGPADGLPPQGQISLSVTFQAKTSTDALADKLTINRVMVEGATDGTTIAPPAEDDASIRVTNPMVAIAKTVTDPLNGAVGVNELVTFTIAITNTGDTTLSIIPVRDVYIPEDLEFVHTSLTTPAQREQGELFWSDLTTELGDIVPGDFRAFTLTFRFINENVGFTTNVTGLGDVIDEYGDFAGTPQGAADASVVTRRPTAIALLSFTAITTTTGIEVRWMTGAEIEALGFHLWRGQDGNRENAVRVTAHMILAEGRGGAGASYQFIDTGAEHGISYKYWLQEVELDGDTAFHGPIIVKGTAGSTPLRTEGLFLPIINH